MTARQAERRPIIRLALSRAEVALAIGVSAGSVDQMVSEGFLPPPRKWHSRKLWLVSEIEAHVCEWPIEGVNAHNEWDDVQPISAAAPRKHSSKAVSDADPLRDYYDRIGFDPKTMDESDRLRLHKAAEEKWKASIPGTPLNKREQKSLLQFREYEINRPVAPSAIKGCGPDTAERLEARGYIEIRQNRPDRYDCFILTKAGKEAL